MVILNVFANLEVRGGERGRLSTMSVSIQNISSLPDSLSSQARCLERKLARKD